VNKYVVELRRLAEYCEFGTLNESLRDQFVVGLKDEHTQKKLLAVADLTFVKAIEIAVAVETANKNATELRGKSNPESSVHKVQRHHRPTSSVKTGKQKIFVCYRCNGMNHRPDNCKFIDVICHNCNKRGHIRKACKSAVKSKQNHKRKFMPYIMRGVVVMMIIWELIV
jgi:hypothetical protein